MKPLARPPSLMYQLLPDRLNIFFLSGVLNDFDMGKKKGPGQVHSCKKSSCMTVDQETFIARCSPCWPLNNDVSQLLLKIIGLEFG